MAYQPTRLIVLLLIVLLMPGANRMLAAGPPNVLVILTDDQGWGDLSLNGNRNLSTPHIDSLARDGVRFEHFFVCPVCSPTRAEFLTGRYHPRGGVYSTSAGGERLDLDEKTIADAFRAAGYRTAAFGKWHNGMQYPYHPCGRGFEEYYGFCSGHWGEYFSPMLEHNGRIVQGNGFVIDDFTDHAIDFMQRDGDRPFFIYLPYNTPHSPMQVPDEWWDRFADKPLEMRHRDPEKEEIPHTRAALAMCENIDRNVGRLLARLDELQIADETIVVYFCDNGPNGWRWNGGMKGRKGSTDEGGVRSPLLIRWPGRIKAGHVVESIAGAIDLLPTLADLAGVPVLSEQPLDGTSLKPLITSAAPDGTARMLFSHWNSRVSVRTQQYRLDHQGKLFDMHSDPGQDRDVSRQHPDVAEQLRNEVAVWKAELLPELGKDNRPFPVGHAEFTFTQLPARDATTTGSIRRSSRFPNCSYFTNWTSIDDVITWDVEVLAGGEYDVEVYYTCPAADVGSTILLSCGAARLEGLVGAVHDPPVTGAANDRVPRQESYVKQFKPLRLGRIKLQAGRAPMRLQATEIAAEQVMELRLVMLTRAD